MPDFVYDNGALAGNKVDLTDPPEGSNPQNFCVSAEWNALCQATVDVRTAILAGKYHGLALQNNGYVPPGTGYRLWARQNGKLFVKNGSSPEVELLTASRSVTAGTGLTGGGALTEDRTLSLAPLSPSPAGTYRNVAETTVNARGQVTAVTTGTPEEEWDADHFDYLDTGRWTKVSSDPDRVYIAGTGDDDNPSGWLSGGWLSVQTGPDTGDNWTANEETCVKGPLVFSSRSGLTLRGKLWPQDYNILWWKVGFFSSDATKAIYFGTNSSTKEELVLCTQTSAVNVTEVPTYLTAVQVEKAVWFELAHLASQVRLRVWLDDPASNAPSAEITSSTNLPAIGDALGIRVSISCGEEETQQAVYVDYLRWKQ